MPSNAGGAGSIPGEGAKIQHALRPSKTKTKKFNKYCLFKVQVRTLKMAHIKKT